MILEAFRSTTTYTYDGDGVRLQASTGTSAANKTNFVWDLNQGLPQVALERNGSNTVLRQYIYGLKRIRQTVGTASYYHTDQLGSVTNTTSASGASQRTWSYEPYGVIRTSSGSSPASFVNFTGEYLDPTGLYHLRARQYDPASGRFTRTDPLETGSSDPGLSAYAYVEGRPTVSVDPRGLRSEPSTAGRNSAAFSTTGVSPANGNPTAIRSLSSAGNPNRGDQCTTVPDEIRMPRVVAFPVTLGVTPRGKTLIDFSPSCQAHDDCYGFWGSWRKNCDDTFHGRMKNQCRSEYRHTILLGPVDGPLRYVCNKIADLYYFGVQKLGGGSWPDKAFRYGPSLLKPERGCPWIGVSGQRPDVPRCYREVQQHSYDPIIPLSRGAMVTAIAKKSLEAWLPIYG